MKCWCGRELTERPLDFIEPAVMLICAVHGPVDWTLETQVVMDEKLNRTEDTHANQRN